MKQYVWRKDRHGNDIHEGEIVEGYFRSPLNAKVFIRRRFIVVNRGGQLFCEGLESSVEDGWLSHLQGLQVVPKPKL